MNYKKDFLAKIYITIFACLFSASLHLYSCDFVCDQQGCEKEFTSQANLTLHKTRTHNICNKCHTKFETKSELVEHKKTCSFRCSEPGCTYTCKTSQHLRTHMLTHTRTTDFRCDLCQRPFKQISHLKRHIRDVHEKIKTHTCPVCKECFARKEALKDHVKTHRGERSFICSECGKRCSRQSDLTEHMRIHTGARPYKCTYPGCTKSFYALSNLKDHQKSHEAPTIPCPKCRKLFKLRSHLQRHIRTIHAEKATKQYICQRCQKSFSILGRFKNHTERYCKQPLPNPMFPTQALRPALQKQQTDDRFVPPNKRRRTE